MQAIVSWYWAVETIQ